LSDLDDKIIEKLRKQIIKSAMDLLILAQLRAGAMSGYDAIGFIHTKFGIMISSGTIYSHLYALEREGLIKGDWGKKKRVYCITEKGKQALEAVAQINTELLDVLQNMLGT
jgi:DNA-binding PadR family transcriptional regulator